MRSVTAALLLVVGCAPGGVDTDAGMDAPAASWRDVDWSSHDRPQDVVLPPDAPIRSDAIAELVDAFGLAMITSVALGDDVDGLRRLSGATEADAQAALEAGLAADALFVPSSCAVLAWAGATATLTLTDCTLAQTRVAVTGTVAITVSVSPTPSFLVALDGMMLRTSTLTGTIRLYPIEDDPRLWRLVDVDLAYTSPRGTGTFAGERFTVNGDTPDEAVGIYAPARVSIDGAGEGDALVFCAWLGDDCIPSNGAVDFSGGSFAGPVRVDFAPTTPVDGRAYVGGTRLTALFVPCR